MFNEETGIIMIRWINWQVGIKEGFLLRGSVDGHMPRAQGKKQGILCMLQQDKKLIIKVISTSGLDF